jgi:hypothetical protein
MIWSPIAPEWGYIMQLMDERPYTLTVPDAGRIYFGLGRNAAYAAAARGDIPTIRIGRLLKVPIAAIEKKLQQAE